MKGGPPVCKGGVRALNILGINAYGHDAAAVLLVDGRTVFAASEERYDRSRHSAAFPARAVAAALAHAGLAPADLDAIAFPWSRGMGRLPKAWHVLRGLPGSLAFLREPPDTRIDDRRGYLRNMVGISRRLRDHGLEAPLHRIPHHLAHAVSATLGMPDGSGVVMTADGMGEWTTAATWIAERGHVRRDRRAVYPHSPGKVYAAVTAWLGFRPESDEGKTMGLAAYGTRDTPGYTFARQLLAPDARRLLRVDTRCFSFPQGAARLYGDAFLDVLGPARNPDEPIRDGDADVALGVQHAVEAFAREAVDGLRAERGTASLGLAGGLFLNCAMNGVLARHVGAALVAPFPVAGDAGAAWGAAAEVHRRLTGSQASPIETLRLGHEITTTDATRAAPDAPALEPSALATALVAQLRAGKILGIAQGRAEFGPRALGARSVIALPTSEAVRDEVNRRKGRESWRPLAPMVRVADTRWFESGQANPWMISTDRATAKTKAEAPGVVHADGTARVQTLDPGREPLLHAVLDGLDAAGSPPVIINTSLNRRGEPIVNTAEEALVSAKAMRLDALVLADRIVALEA